MDCLPLISGQYLARNGKQIDVRAGVAKISLVREVVYTIRYNTVGDVEDMRMEDRRYLNHRRWDLVERIRDARQRELFGETLTVVEGKDIA